MLLRMSARRSENRRPRLNKLNSKFWRDAALRAELTLLVRKGARIKPQGLAHLVAEYADSLDREYRARFQR